MSEFMQLTRTSSGGTLANGSNVVFTNVTYKTSGIDYNFVNGEINFLTTGRYLINWWVSSQSTEGINKISLSMPNAAQSYNVITENPNANGQTSGSLIVQIDIFATTLGLTNNSGADIFYSNSCAETAGLIVTQLDVLTLDNSLVAVQPGDTTFNLTVNDFVPFGEVNSTSGSDIVLVDDSTITVKAGEYEIDFTSVVYGSSDAYVIFTLDGVQIFSQMAMLTGVNHYSFTTSTSAPDVDYTIKLQVVEGSFDLTTTDLNKISTSIRVVQTRKYGVVI